MIRVGKGCWSEKLNRGVVTECPGRAEAILEKKQREW